MKLRYQILRETINDVHCNYMIETSDNGFLMRMRPLLTDKHFCTRPDGQTSIPYIDFLIHLTQRIHDIAEQQGYEILRNNLHIGPPEAEISSIDLDEI